MNTPDLAYLAAVFDHKANFYFSNRAAKPGHVRPCIEISLSDHELAYVLQARFGGYIQQRRACGSLIWRAQDKTVRHALELLRPHLLLQQDKADTFLAFWTAGGNRALDPRRLKKSPPQPANQSI